MLSSTHIFLCTHLNVFKYSYLTLIVLFSHCWIVSSIAIQYKYFYLHMVKWFQELLPYTNIIICLQLNDFQYSLTVLYLEVLLYKHEWFYLSSILIQFNTKYFVAYWPLTEPSIRDLWHRTFQPCEQENSSRRLTSRSRSRESPPEERIGIRKNIHGYPRRDGQSRESLSASCRHKQERAEALVKEART